jgi:glycosyltransferase involved in cell wall biosynthesis
MIGQAGRTQDVVSDSHHPTATALRDADRRDVRVMVVGPMVGRHQGYVTTQGEVLAGLLAAAGYDVRAVSSSANRYIRLLDIAATLLRRGLRTDVILLQTFGGPSFVVEDVASALGRLFGCKVVLHLHGGALPEFFARFPRWTRRVLDRAHAMVAPSRFLAEAVVPYGHHARVIHNVIELGDYPFTLRRRVRPRLFWMRTFHPLYNPLMALRVLERVKRVHPDASLTMGGQDKGLLAEVRSEAERMGLADSLRLCGFLDQDGKRREAGGGRDGADIYINTNHVDNTPVAVIEAAALGLPVVATRVGGVEHLLDDGETGLLVDDDDDAAMAAAVLRLIDDPGLAERLSANGRALAESSAWDRVHADWQRLFDELTPPRVRVGREDGG